MWEINVLMYNATGAAASKMAVFCETMTVHNGHLWVWNEWKKQRWKYFNFLKLIEKCKAWDKREAYDRCTTPKERNGFAGDAFPSVHLCVTGLVCRSVQTNRSLHKLPLTKLSWASNTFEYASKTGTFFCFTDIIVGAHETQHETGNL